MGSHQHSHQHPHRDSHSVPHQEVHNAAAGGGPVMVDVGGGAGALILHAGTDLIGAEIEISPAGRDERRTHVAVLARPLGGRIVPAAVYPSLLAGSWNLWDPVSNTLALVVTIQDGEITQARWPEVAADQA